jgi:hypothetical protein
MTRRSTPLLADLVGRHMIAYRRRTVGIRWQVRIVHTPASGLQIPGIIVAAGWQPTRQRARKAALAWIDRNTTA